MMKGFYNKFWSVEEVALLKFWYPKMTNLEIGKRLGKNESAIIAKAFKLRLIKDKEFIIRCSKISQFKPGHISFNKGLKQTQFMSLEAIERTKTTRFKKGNLPHNARQADGEISKRGGYWYIRISLANWRVYHHLLYERFIGEIPKGHIVIFKDNNPDNLCPTNFQLISHNENMMRNTIQRFPPELIATIKTLSKLKKQLKNHGA